jgi:hypothetical protein
VKRWGSTVWSSATTVDEARWLEAHGADAVIAQGLEAGGHRGHFLDHDLTRQAGTFALLPQVVQAVRVPVIAAGGIADAAGVRAALALGATASWPTWHESRPPAGAAQAHADAPEGPQHQQLPPPAARDQHADGLRGHARHADAADRDRDAAGDDAVAGDRRQEDGVRVIMRAGSGFLDGMLEVVPGARVGHIGLYRDPKTLVAVEYYFKMPHDMHERDAIVLDPMLATGNSAVAAVERLKETRPRRSASSACWPRPKA